MLDIDYDELEDLSLTMEEEDGTTMECELHVIFEYEGEDYGAFHEVDSMTGEFYFFLLGGAKNRKGEIELEIEPVEDDDLLEKLAAVLQQIIDEEDEPELEDDEDDGMWDEFIHKKLDD